MSWERNGVLIVCLQSCAVYKSINEAARAADVAPSSIMRAVRSGRACKGLFYARVPRGLFAAGKEALRAWCTVELLRRVGAVSP